MTDDAATEQTDLDRLWMAMDCAIERHEHASMVAQETEDPFWNLMATLSAATAERAIAAYEAAKGGNRDGQ
jgi:hypothetical protein